MALLFVGESFALSRSPPCSTARWTDVWTDVLHGLSGPAGRWAEALNSTDQLSSSCLRTLRCDSQLSPQRP